jgi:geranylgeranyl diphosphate synthase type I
MFDPAAPLSAAFQQGVTEQLEGFLTAQGERLSDTGDRLDLLWSQARRVVAGGKRMRPAFCYWGCVAAGHGDLAEPIVRVAASFDLLHAAALIHDDIIDRSDTRRGHPAAHRAFAQAHAARGWSGSSERFGHDVAIVFGDLLLAAAVAMVERSGVAADRLGQARPYLDAARTEVMAGQYLDLLLQAEGSAASAADAALVVEFKTAKYTVTRPVQAGAALGWADPATLAGLGRFGSHLGQGYQLVDDLLGLFGDPAATGKPVGDDLREGKRTYLIAAALERARPAAAARLTTYLGNPVLNSDQVAAAQSILVESGAVAATQRRLAQLVEAALAELTGLDLTEPGRTALIALTHAAVDRVA